MTNLTIRFYPVLLACLLAGCGDGGTLCGVSGAVTLDGAPLTGGYVAFIRDDPTPAEGGLGQQGSAPIENGRYKLAAERGLAKGKFKVEIRNPRPKPGSAPGKGEFDSPPTEETIPEKYNVKTELTAEIVGKSNMKDFPLTSK